MEVGRSLVGGGGRGDGLLADVQEGGGCGHLEAGIVVPGVRGGRRSGELAGDLAGGERQRGVGILATGGFRPHDRLRVCF